MSAHLQLPTPSLLSSALHPPSPQRRLIEAYEDRVLLDAEYLQQLQDKPQDDDDAGDEPPAPDAAEVEAIRRQADQYIKLLQRPLFQGCRAYNALHADFMLFEWRHQFAVGDRAFNALLKVRGRLLGS